MKIKVTGAEAHRLAVIADGLRASARVHKQSIKANRDALKAVMQALRACEEIIDREAGDKHGGYSEDSNGSSAETV